MKLESIIKKSRKLLNKFKSNGKIILSEEDYFMLSVSLFVAKKESIIKKDNSSNTLYFDYNKYKREYERYSHVIDEISKSSTINIVTPDNKRYDLTKDRCFDGIDDLVFPLNGKIEVLNFDGTIEELNEIKRVIWIISKIRDSFVHGDKFSFDFENKKIKIDNSISDKILGEFEIKIDIDPKLLVYLCEKENIYKDYEFYDNYNYNIKYKYDYYDNIIDNEFKEPFKIKKNYFREDIIISKISRELDYINDIKVLNELKNILMKFSKIHNKLTVEEKEKFFKRFLRLIKMYSERSKQDSLAC